MKACAVFTASSAALNYNVQTLKSVEFKGATLSVYLLFIFSINQLIVRSIKMSEIVQHVIKLFSKPMLPSPNVSFSNHDILKWMIRIVSV